MEEKINIVELLKDCPIGMELDCAMYNKVTLVSVDDREDIIFPIKVMREDGNTLFLTKYGQYSGVDFAKCIIFPKGKTTWEGFVPPCKFKDGDIIYVKSAYKWVAIYKESNGDDLHKYVGIRVLGDVFVNDCNPLCYKGDIREIRYATKEERQKLFNAIKDNGYKWNTETNTLEKLIEPEFKVGDRIKWIKTGNIYEIIKILSNCYIAKYLGSDITILFDRQDEYELIPNKFDITTLKPFESRVLIRDFNDNIWVPAFWGKLLEKDSGYRYLTTCDCYKYCIPYEGNEHLLGTTNDCAEYFKVWE